MKKLFATLLISLTCPAIFSQNIVLNPVVDERSELLSIVFRLADSPEYMNSDIKRYTDDIDNYFKTYKNDELIKFVRKINASRSAMIRRPRNWSSADWAICICALFWQS